MVRPQPSSLAHASRRAGAGVVARPAAGLQRSRSARRPCFQSPKTWATTSTFPHCKLESCVPALWLQFFSTPFRVQSQFRAHKRTMLWLFLLEAIEEAIEEVIEETIVESNATHA